MNRRRKRVRRTILGYKQYLILKKIQELEDKGEDVYIARLAKELKGSVVWGYIVLVIGKFEKKGLITTETKGRIRFIKLTDKGREAIRLAEKLMEVMGFNPEE